MSHPARAKRSRIEKKEDTLQRLDPDSVRLSSRTSVARFRALVASRNQEALAQFLHDRFTERYLRPLDVGATIKSGFTMMAIACLMIEALESFYQGWADTRGKSERAFGLFFGRSLSLGEFSSISGLFYTHVRCGILHQAETTGGWRIRRTGNLLDPTDRIVNANKFVAGLDRDLSRYCQNLRTEPWDSETWTNFRAKMQAVCGGALRS